MPDPSSSDHPLARLLESSGVPLGDAAAYVARAHWVGDVCFAAGAACEADAERLKASRGSFLRAAGRGAKKEEMNNAILGALSLDPGAAAGPSRSPMSIDEKKRLAREMWEPGGIAQALKLEHAEALDLLTGADLHTQARFSNWSQASEAAKNLAARVPAVEGASWVEDDGESALDPSAIEERLHGRAKALMERFGVGGVRIPGFPGFKRAEASLAGLEVAFANMAASMGIPEKAMGLGGGWTFVMGKDFFDSGGMCAYGVKTISMGRQNGWAALAHEWFHALDYEAANALGLETHSLATEAAEAPGQDGTGRISLSKWRAFRASKDQASAPSLIKAAQDLMDKIRWADSAPETARRAAESTRESVARLEREMFERPGRPLPLAIPEDRARTAFRAVAADVLDGKAGAGELKKWREASMGAMAESRAVWDGVVLAERLIKESAMGGKLAESKATFMQEYSAAVETAIAEKMKDKKWAGYMDTPCEMSARAFEGCFEDLPADVRKFMVAAEPSAIWSQGSERGAAREQFKHYLSEVVDAMRKSGALSDSVPEDWRLRLSQASGAPASELPSIEDGSAAKKMREMRAKAGASASAGAPMGSEPRI